MRLLIISHPAVLPVNQEVYRELAFRGVDVTIVVPSRWRHEYAKGSFPPTALPGLEGRLLPLRVVLAGKPQRHFHVTRPAHVLARTRPDVAFVEAEPFAIVATQWGAVLYARGVPFGVQGAENIDRSLPLPVRVMRRSVLQRASFVAARSQTAANLVRFWGAQGKVAFVPHAVPDWKVDQSLRPERPFTIGYAGRLVPEKGLEDLLAAVRRLEAPVELLLVGNGELRSMLEGQPIPGSRVRVVTGLRHEQMAVGYAGMDVLALPSRTTAHWKEQFGRAIVEALWCGVPVVGSDSGEIPWLIDLTKGGVTFPEGDIGALTARLAELRDDPRSRARLGADGRAAVERMFTVSAVADVTRDLLERVRS